MPVSVADTKTVVLPIDRGALIHYMCTHLDCTTEVASSALRSVRTWLTDHPLRARFYVLAFPEGTIALTDRSGARQGIDMYDACPINHLDRHSNKNRLHRYLRSLIATVEH